MTKVLVLGARGMLGGMITRVLRANPALEVSATARASGDSGFLGFDASRDSADELLHADDYEWVINAIGIVKPRIEERDPTGVALAIDVNAAFPHRLAAAARPDQRVIQIATDGVFSGAAGPYDEIAPHDATDIYARTKSLGEVAAAHVLHLRCSVVGPEPDRPASLLGWVLSQPRGARINGYTNHRWNGVTTWHFARLCEAVITRRLADLPSPLHVVPADLVTKAELLELILVAFGRTDITVSHGPAEVKTDRTLSTRHVEANRRLWGVVGYEAAPTIESMIGELAAVTQEAGSP